MVTYTFGPELAYDATSNGVAKAADFQVFAVDDLAGATPLATTDLYGLPTPVRSNAVGVVPAFRVEDHVQVRLVSGPHAIPLTAVGDIAATAMAAQAAAAQSASDASAAASLADASAASADLLAVHMTGAVLVSTGDESRPPNVGVVVWIATPAYAGGIPTHMAAGDILFMETP